MNRFQRFALLLIPGILLFAGGTFLGARLGGVFSHPDTLEELRKLEDAFLLIDRQYVEEVSPSSLVDSAIEAMLGDLDPHSTYIDAESARRVQMQYRGSFGGIGIWFEAAVDDTARVTSIIPDGPSESAGLMPGDLIIAVNDSSVIGMISTDIQDRIMGPVNTPVDVTVKRRGAQVDFTITRGRIPLSSIDASYMIDGEIGYIRIGRFAMTTHDEFVASMSELKAAGMNKLVLDLRDNPGGIKQTAVSVANEFLPGGKTIVSTRGRLERETEIDISTSGGIFENGPVIVLVNENTASGSEIVSGALQDHDRALIVGRRTFGKGLVQRPFELRDGSILQLTVSRYYMPSGRLIQSPYESGDLEAYYKSKFSTLKEATFDPSHYLHDIPDSLRYETSSGRTVFGGGGVMPDQVVVPDSTAGLRNPVVRAAFGRGLDVLFVRSWFLEREPELRANWSDRRAEFIESFQPSSEMLADFWESASENGVFVGSVPEGQEGIAFSTEEIEEAAPIISRVLKARLAQRLFLSEAWFPIINPVDQAVEEALGLWEAAETLAQ